MKSLFRFLLLAVAVFTFATSLAFADTSVSVPIQAASSAAGVSHPVVVMLIEHGGQPLGKISIELFPEDAPISVANFVKLVNNKFYDGLTFHRIAELNGSTGKIVQGGDPSGNGSGGPGWTIKGEFSANGVNNPLVHDAGAVAMARAGDPNSAGSQFYICVDPVHFLDGNYAVFGKVIDGLDVAGKNTARRQDDLRHSFDCERSYIAWLACPVPRASSNLGCRHPNARDQLHSRRSTVERGNSEYATGPPTFPAAGAQGAQDR